MIFPPAQIQRIPTPLLWVGHRKPTPYVRPLARQRTALASADYIKTTLAAANDPTHQRASITPLCLAAHDGHLLATHTGHTLAVSYGKYHPAAIARPGVPASQRAALTTWTYTGNPESPHTDTAAQSATLATSTYARHHTTTHAHAAAQRVGLVSQRIQPSGSYSSPPPLRQRTTLAAYSYESKK